MNTDELTVVEVTEELYDEEDNQPATLWSAHGTKVVMKSKRGKAKGKEVPHFKCGYCRDKCFQGPSSTAFLEHLRKVHPKRCPELLPNVKKVPKDFFESNFASSFSHL